MAHLGATLASALLALFLGGTPSSAALLRARGRHVSTAIRKPLTDQRSYEHAVFLGNGLKVLAVHDPKAAKAGFAVAVEAGSFYDPAALPGLAHFTEHLLFLGTKKYPDEASFDNFMSQHDGQNNAYTEQERTVFYNEVNHAGFDEGMDRFAQFFVAPLFKGDMVGRELNAVNSEHEKNKPDQNRRLWEVMRGTARKDSVLSRFYTGTTESLHHGDNKTVQALREYHDSNYCAPRMNLVMVSNLSTAELLEVAHKHFDDVPRGNCGSPHDFGETVDPTTGHSLAAMPFDAEHLGQFIQMGTESTPTLWMMFPLPPTLKLYKEGPTQYLEYVLGYSGPKSLKSRLKRKGLITGLGLQVDETTAATLVFVTFDLTPKGAEDKNVRDIADTTFAFLRLLKEERRKEVPAVYDSLKSMNQVSFDYVEAPDSVMDAVADLASSLAQYPPEDILTGTNGVIDRVNVTRVRNMLAMMSRPGGVNMGLAKPNFNISTANRFEEYYNIRFHQAAIPPTWVSRWASREAEDELRTPPALHFVPSKLQVINDTAGLYPISLQVHGPDAKRVPLELWWKGKGEFALPKAQVRLLLRVPDSWGTSAEAEAMKRLHSELARQILEEPTEDMQNCGLTYDVQPVGSGYQLSIDGYDQHIGSLLQEALGGLLAPSFGASEFAHAHRQVKDELTDTTRQLPYQWAMDAMSALTTSNVFGREEVLAELEKVDEAKLRTYVKKLHADGLRVQILVVGNIDEMSAMRLATAAGGRVTGGLAHNKGKLLEAKDAQHAQVLIAETPMELRIRNPIPGDMNHATVNAYQYGVPDVSERVRLLLLGKMIANPVYDTLRTKKQLGYVVFGFMQQQVSVLELRVLVQGAKELPDLVDIDIETVLVEFGQSLKQMSKAEFTKWKASLASSLHHKDQNMGQETDRYWGQIINDGHCFNRKELAIQYLDTLQTVDDVLQTFDTLRNHHRKVSVKMFGAGIDPHSVAPAVKAGSLVRVDAVSTAVKLSLENRTSKSLYYSNEEKCRIVG